MNREVGGVKEKVGLEIRLKHWKSDYSNTKYPSLAGKGKVEG